MNDIHSRDAFLMSKADYERLSVIFAKDSNDSRAGKRSDSPWFDDVFGK